MPPCSQCGTDNPLGRVFCGKCGGRLDLTHMSLGEIAEDQAAIRIRWVVRKLVTLAILAALAAAGFALWPQTTVLGKDNGRTGADRVSQSLASLGNGNRRRSLPVAPSSSTRNPSVHSTTSLWPSPSQS